MSLPKKAVYFLTAAIVLVAVVALILGLVLGLKSPKEKEKTEAEKFQTCKELTCGNPSLLQELNNQCSQTTRQTITTVATTRPPVVIDYRLPTNLMPYHYDIVVGFQFETFDSNKNGFPYNGEVTINFKCTQDTSSLVLHVNKLDLDNSTLSVKSLTDSSYGEFKAFAWTNDFDKHFFIASFSKPFSAGHSYTFSVKFTGYLTDDNAGFYRSSYTDANGVKKWLMTSQLESTDARKSFPCFDEPAFKATWAISAIHQKDYNALSNMPVAGVTDVGNNRVRTDFETIPAMSSYLVALAVSDFVCIYGKANSGLAGDLPIGSCGKSTTRNQLEFGLDVGIRIIEHFQNLYKVKYPLPKCDHIAIPDFAAGAMENWGLVTYRQAQYLFNPGVTTRGTEQAIASTVVHEIAHMWFGNIVSPKWWNDIWLNEGFATFNEYMGTHVLKPHYQIIDQFKNVFFNLMWSDSAPTRSISFDVGSPSQISNMFDSITYSKGGSIIWMVQNFLGNETYYKGQTRYLERYSFGNTDGQMLWNTMNEVAQEEGKLGNLQLNDIMNTWIKQSGHPVVTIKRVDDKTISLTQNQFLLDPSSPSTVASPYNYRYYVPFTHTIEKIGATNSDTVNLSSDNIWQKVTWFTPSEGTTKTVTLSRPLADDEFVLANLRAAGYYRVNYDNHFWDRIVKQLLANKDAIPVENRAQFIQDSFGFSEARIIDGEKPFEIIQYMSKEDKELPWLALINRVGYFYNMLVTTSAYGNYQTFMSELIRPFFNKLDWDEKDTDTWIEKQMRTNVVSFSCLRGVPECVDKAKTRFAAWMDQESVNPIPAAYRAFIYCTAIREGAEKEWNFAFKRYKNENDATERNNLLNGMSCTKQTWLVSRFLNEQLENTRVADGLSALRSAAIRPDAILKTWNFVKENWASLYQKYTTGMGGLLVDFSTTFNTQFLLDDFNLFFSNNANQNALANQITTARNRIDRNVQWHQKNFKSVNLWFSIKYDQSKTQSSDDVVQQSPIESTAPIKPDQDEIITFAPKMMELNLL